MTAILTTRLPRSFFAGLMATAWLAVLLAALGCFSVLACLLLGVLAAGWAWRLSAGRPLDRYDALATGAALGLLFLATPPDEQIRGSWDPGVYVQASAMVDRTGGLRWDVPSITSLPASERALFFLKRHQLAEPFGGVYLHPDGRMVPTFFHLYPSLMAIAHRAGGVPAALWLNPLLGAAAVLAFFAFMSRMVERRHAALAACLFALNPAMIWQAGFPTAEMLTQFLLLGGLTFAARAIEGDGPSGVLAGAGLGLAMLCRYDTLMFLAPWFAVLLLSFDWKGSRRGLGTLYGVAAALILHTILHQRFVTTAYHPLPGIVALAGGALLAGLALGFYLLNAPRVGLRDALARHAPRLRWIRAGMVLAFFVWAWFIRPRLPEWPEPLGGAQALNLFHLKALFGTVGLAAAVIGVIVLLLEGHDAWRRAWLFAAVGVTGLLVVNIFNDQFMLWLSRRFIPVVVPLLVAGQAYLVWVLVRRFAPRTRLVAAAVAIAALLATNVPAIRVVARSQDWPGLAAWLEQVSQAVPSGARVYVDQPGFAAPLRFLHNVEAFELCRPAKELRGKPAEQRAPLEIRRAKLAEVMCGRLRAGEQLLLLSAEGPLVDARVKCESVGSFPLATRELMPSVASMPVGWKSRGGNFALYRITLQATDHGSP